MPRPYGRTHPDVDALIARDPGGSDEIGDEEDDIDPDDEDDLDDDDDLEDADEDVDTSDFRRHDDGVSDLRGSLEIWKELRDRR